MKTKILILTLIFAAGATALSAQKRQLENYSRMEDAIYVYISKDMLQLAPISHIEKVSRELGPNVDLKKIYENINSVEIAAFSEGPERPDIMRNDARKLSSGKQFEVVAQMSANGMKLELFGKKERNGTFTELVIYVEANEVTALAYVGCNLTIEDLRMMSELAMKPGTASVLEGIL